MVTRGYEGTRAYRQSKLAQVMFTIDLAEQLKDAGITVNCLHPATFMNTNMVIESGYSPTSSVEEGADAILHARHVIRTGGKDRPLFRRPAAGARQRAGLRCRRAPPSLGSQHAPDGPRQRSTAAPAA